MTATPQRPDDVRIYTSAAAVIPLDSRLTYHGVHKGLHQWHVRLTADEVDLILSQQASLRVGEMPARSNISFRWEGE